MITLYRGDDTTFKGVKRLRVTIESKESLAGCSATFEVCGVVKHVPDVSTGSFYLSLTGEDTAKMPLGTHVATLRVYDDESRRRTVANTIMVCVTERIGDAYPGEEDIAVSLGAMVEWRNVSDKPSVNGVVLEGNKTTKELGIKGVVEATLVDLPEDYTPEGLRAAVNAINACLRASMACAAVAACALFAPCAAWAEDEAATTDGETAAEAAEGETPSRVTVREFGDMTSMSKQFKALSSLTAVVTAVDLEGLATDDALDTLKVKVEAEATARHDADTNLAAQVSAVSSALDTEKDTRATADKANADAIAAAKSELRSKTDLAVYVGKNLKFMAVKAEYSYLDSWGRPSQPYHTTWERGSGDTRFDLTTTDGYTFSGRCPTFLSNQQGSDTLAYNDITFTVTYKDRRCSFVSALGTAWKRSPEYWGEEHQVEPISEDARVDAYGLEFAEAINKYADGDPNSGMPWAVTMRTFDPDGSNYSWVECYLIVQYLVVYTDEYVGTSDTLAKKSEVDKVSTEASKAVAAASAQADAKITAVSNLVDKGFIAWTNGTTIAAGKGAKVSSDVTHTKMVSIGASSLVGNEYAIAVGANAKATGPGSVVVGANCSASGKDATSVNGNEVAGERAVVAGAWSAANGHSAVAVGTSSNAHGDLAVAVGASNNVHSTARAAVVIGSGLASFSPGSVIIGRWDETPLYNYSKAYGSNTVVIGRNTLAMYTDNIAIGTSAVATNKTATSAIAIGKSANAMSTSSMAIGNGAKAGGVDRNWYRIGATAIGNNAHATFGGSTAIGKGAKAIDYGGRGGTTAIGNGATANRSYSTAIGCSTGASGSYSTAVGYGSKANGNYSVAIGDATPGEPIVYEVWTNDVSVVLDDGSVSNSVEVVTNETATAVGYANAAGIHSLALGYMAYAPARSVGMAYSPDRFYFCSSNTSENAGATARTLQSYLDEKADKTAISATDTTFSNAVLAVTTSFDENTVARINTLLEEGAKLPTTGVVGVGTALAAIAAALAALKKSLAETNAKVSAANTTLEEVA